MKEIFVAQFGFYIQGTLKKMKNVNFRTQDVAHLECVML